MSVDEKRNGFSFGFVGLGDMGAPMAANLAAGLEAGSTLYVHDIAIASKAVPPTAQIVQSLAEMAAVAEVVFVSVPDGDSSEAVVAGLLEQKASRVRCVVNLSTVGIQSCQRIVGQLPGDAFDYIDAPVSGGRAGAINATITVMWSGNQVLFNQLQPALSNFAGSVFFVGPEPGQGQALKLLNNYLSGVAMTATSEAVRFGLHHGLDMKTMLDVVHVSTGQNMAVSDKFPKRILTDSFDAGFRMALMQKDIALYHDAVTAAGTPSKVLKEVSRYWRQGVERYPDGDFTEVFKLINGEPEK